jgi:glycosyltransferase involved in cell wall biosynthesis
MREVASKLGALVERRRPDVVVSSPLWMSLLVMLARGSFPVSTRIINRADAPPSVALVAQPDMEDLYTFILREHFGGADRIIAVSDGVMRDLTENHGIDPGRIEVVRNPFELERIAALAEEPVDEPVFSCAAPVVLYVGRLERVKGPEFLVRAIAEVLDGHAAHLVIVGDGSQREYLETLSKHLGIDEHVSFLGSRANPFKYMRRATMLVLPSLSEGFGNVLLEAMACGCPLVATDIPGATSELLEGGKCGLIVAREDPSALSSAISRLLCDPALRAVLAENGVRRAQEFDAPVIVPLYESLLCDVLRDREIPGEAELRDPVSPADEGDSVAAARCGQREVEDSG